VSSSVPALPDPMGPARDDEEICTVDGRPVRMSIFKGTGYCCQNCQHEGEASGR
jgi:hypothetical protein